MIDKANFYAKIINKLFALFNYQFEINRKPKPVKFDMI